MKHLLQLLFVFAALVGHTNVRAGVEDDEISLKLLFMCSTVYRGDNHVVYERDTNARDQVEKGFIQDVNNHYSSNDAKLLLGVSIIASRTQEFDARRFDPVKICRSTVQSLISQKERTGSYLSDFSHVKKIVCNRKSGYVLTIFSDHKRRSVKINDVQATVDRVDPNGFSAVAMIDGKMKSIIYDAKRSVINILPSGNDISDFEYLVCN